MGELFALLAAIVWASAVILFKRSGETVPPFALNVFRITISAALFFLTLAVIDQPLWGQAPPRDYLILAASGVIAITISDTLFHMCLNRVGAGINAIVDCLYSPLVILFAVLILQERIGGLQLVGMFLVIGGVLLTVRHAPPPGTTRRNLVLGICFGVLAIASLAFGIVIAKPVLERSPVIWATAMRQFGALLTIWPVALLGGQRRQVFAAFRPSRSWRFTLPGTVLGSYLALIFWIMGMKFTKAGTAAILNQTSTIYILIFAAFFLGERLTRRKLAAAGLALMGIMLVMVG